MPGNCNHCGSPTTNPRLCANCSVAHAGPQIDDVDHDCPVCDGPTSGPDTVCYQCRRGE